MAGISSLTNIWENVKEVDLRPIREEALQVVRLAVAGGPGSGRQALAERLRRDPARPEVRSDAPLPVLDLDASLPQPAPDLIIVMVEAQPGGFERESARVREWARAGRKVLVVVQVSGRPEDRSVAPWVDWGQNRVLYGDPENTAFLLQEFAPAVIELLPKQLTSLGRFFPLFRTAVAHHLINETSFSNAAYSLSTGLAEVVPVFNIPLNVADMVVLTKAQAFLVYRLGLALGMSTEWQDYVTEFGSVLGGGFLWRQLARSLIGLIPAWGIVPKVAVAYAGTYAVGSAVLHWYTAGRHITRKQMRDLYRQAFARGKVMASDLAGKLPRPRIGRRKAGPRSLPGARKALPAGEPAGGGKVCPECGQTSAADAAFCQYCGHPFPAGGGA